MYPGKHFVDVAGRSTCFVAARIWRRKWACRVPCMACVAGAALWVLWEVPVAKCSPPTGLPAGEATQPFVEERNQRYAQELERYLQHWLVEEYPQRAERAWRRDYSSVQAYLASVEPNRQRWRRVLSPPDLPVSGPLERRPHVLPGGIEGQWLSLPMGPLRAEGLLVLPAGDGPVPLIIVQHGIGSYPERPFGVLDEGNAYHRYADELVRAGFAVLAPMNLYGIEARNRIERLCRLADTSLPGIELVRMQRLLDEVLADPRIDEERVGMWGLSLGGLATMFWMPLEPRIQAGVVCAWFNHRRNKMAIPDPRYSCFLEVTEEHAFFRGWLTEFTDSDVVSLICPRPLQVQTGKADRIAWWPQVQEEFAVARGHYEALGLAERIEMDLHDGRHEASVEAGVRFLLRWLGKAKG